MNNGNHFKYWCKQAKICVSKFMINALISSTMMKLCKWRRDFAQQNKMFSFRYTTFKLFPFIGQMFSHSWISAASSRCNLFKLNFYYFYEWVSYRVFSYHHHHRSRARERVKFAEFHGEKILLNILKWNGKIPFNKSKTNKTIGIFVQK